MPPARTPWIKMDADADESYKVARLPNHNARWGWFRMMCRAKTQRRMGVFAGKAHLRQLLGTEGRYVPDMIRVGLLHIWPTDCGRCASDYAGDATDGDLVVHDYRREQRDPTNADRQAEHRGRNAVRNADRNAVRNGSGTVYSRALSPSPSMSPSELPGEDEPYQVADDPEATWRVVQVVEELTGPFGYGRGSGVFDRLASDVAALGPDRVAAAYRQLRSETPDTPMDAAQVVFGAHKRLFPIPDAPRPGKVGKGGVSAEEAERAFGRA